MYYLPSPLLNFPSNICYTHHSQLTDALGNVRHRRRSCTEAPTGTSATIASTHRTASTELLPASCIHFSRSISDDPVFNTTSTHKSQASNALSVPLARGALARLPILAVNRSSGTDTSSETNPGHRITAAALKIS